MAAAPRPALRTAMVPVGRPEMTQQQRNLILRQGKDRGGQVLLVRALAEDAKVLQPLAHSERRPAVAVAADEQLVPVTHAFVAGDAAAEHLGGAAHRALFSSDAVV